MKTFKELLKDPMSIFVGAMVIIAIVIALFTWGSPVSLDNYADKQAIVTMFQEDSLDVTVTRISDVETYKDQTVQSVYYIDNNDSTKSEKVVFLQVKKGFLKYKPVKFI